jgi:hypothetical protein
MTPVKPFDTYKWRWLSVQPTESLLQPSIFLGVLRALEKCEGLSPSDNAVFEALALVEKETQSPATLARDPDRNLLRNSGQYWKGTGLLNSTSRRIELTSLGHKIADGKVTQGEFAAIMVQQTVLPNPYTYKPQEIEKWQNAGLQIKPLILILQILENLGEISGVKNSYLTPNELIKIVIPLAGIKSSFQDISKTLLNFRRNIISTESWPDCAPGANDKRIAREFLLFLSNYGICNCVEQPQQYDSHYYLGELFDIEAVSSLSNTSIFKGDKEAGDVIKEIRSSQLPSIFERQRIVTTILSRSGQPRFRKKILQLSENRCLLTGERISEVLEAAHIIPVTSGGTDDKDNGICLRVDIHRLFDSGNIRIQPSGDLKFSDAVCESDNYKGLPSKVIIPPFVNHSNVEWRNKYW